MKNKFAQAFHQCYASEAANWSRSQISLSKVKKLGMSFLREVESFKAEKLKSVNTTVTTAEGRKVKFKNLSEPIERGLFIFKPRHIKKLQHVYSTGKT